MAIKIINGRAVVVPDNEASSSAKTTQAAPTPKASPSLLLKMLQPLLGAYYGITNNFDKIGAQAKQINQSIPQNLPMAERVVTALPQVSKSISDNMYNGVPGAHQAFSYVGNRMATPAMGIPKGFLDYRELPGMVKKGQYADAALTAANPLVATAMTVGNIVNPIATQKGMLPFASFDALKGMLSAVSKKSSLSDIDKATSKGFTGEDVKGLGSMVSQDPVKAEQLNKLEAIIGMLVPAYHGIKGYMNKRASGNAIPKFEPVIPKQPIMQATTGQPVANMMPAEQAIPEKPGISVKSVENPNIPVSSKAIDPVTALVAKLGAPEQKGILSRIMGKLDPMKEKLAKINPLRFETGDVGSRGAAGQELVTRGRRASAQNIIQKGVFKRMNESTGVTKLTEPEQYNFRDVIEGKATPLNENVAKLAQTYKQMFDTTAGQTGVDRIENYFPRRLNEAGKEFYKKAANKEELIVKMMAEDPKLDRFTAVKKINEGLGKGAFEKSRILDNVSSALRQKPLEELYQWQNEVARRIGIINEFGANDQIANNLISRMGEGSKYEYDIQRKAETYKDRVAGRVNQGTEIDPLLGKLKSAMVVSKMNPLTTISNESQGFLSSWLQYGPKGLVDSMFGKGGKEMVRDLGLDLMKGKIGEEVTAEGFATKWMKGIGMEGSEQRGFQRTAQSTQGAITRAFETLKKNPTDAKSMKLLQDHGMFIEKADLARALLNGKIPDMEMKMGLVEGIRQKMFFQTPGERPAWANSSVGSTSYIFKNYLLNQMQLLAKAPLDRQLAYVSVVAPLMGLPVMVLRRIIQGKPLPEGFMDWYMSSATSGPGTPFDLTNMASSSDSLNSSFLGGFSTPAKVVMAGLGGSPRNTLKALVEGLAPLQGLYSRRLFPPKK